MKNYLLLLYLIYSISSFAQDPAIPINKAGKSSESVLLNWPIDQKAIEKLLSSENEVEKLQVNAEYCTQNELNALLQLLGTAKGISELELNYNGDSLDLNLFKSLDNLQSLSLFSLNAHYMNADSLAKMKNLNFLGVCGVNPSFTNSILTHIKSLDEFQFLSKTMDEFDYSDLMIAYTIDSSHDKLLYLSSYDTVVNLLADSVRDKLFRENPDIIKYNNGRRAYVKSNLSYLIEDNQNQALKSNQSVRYDTIRRFQVHDNIKPFLGNASNQLNYISVDSRSDNNLMLDNQTFLILPANALLDSKGQPYKGEVRIYYRSIRSFAEQLEAGVPMTYDSGGTQMYFQTNGMFEVRAFSDKDEELKLAPGNQIKVTTEVTDDSLNYNLYNLSDHALWNTTSQRLNMSRVPLFYTVLKDKTAFDQRYESLDYCNYLPKNKKAGRIVWYINNRKNIDRRSTIGRLAEYRGLDKKNNIRQKKNLVKFSIISDISDTTNKRTYFAFKYNLNNNNQPVILDIFPELKPFIGYKFELLQYIKSSIFNKTFKKGKYYNDVRIYYVKGDEYGTLELKSENAFVRFEFKVVRYTKRGSRKYDRIFLTAFRKYQMMLDRKRLVFDTYVNSFFNGSRLSSDSSFYDFLTLSDNSKRASYSLDIPSFGLINCDRPIPLSHPITIIRPQYVYDDNTVDSIGIVYVMDNKLRACYYSNPNELRFSMNDVAGMVIVTLNGMVYTIKGEILRALNIQEEGTTLPVKKMQPTEITPENVVNEAGG